ncbi:GGDEF domain-containing protein [Candidatus Omnitrophota bacterium]
MLQRFVGFVQQYKVIVTLLSFVLVLFVGIADFYTGYEFGFSIFYLIPVFVTTWIVGMSGGVVISILSALSWTIAHSYSGLTYSHAFIPYWNIGIRMIFLFIVVATVSQLQKALQRERELARKDFLTEVANTQCFRERANLEIQRCERHKRPLTFAYIDCDDFKKVNDSSGHKQGDVLLKLVAKTIKDNIRSIDLVGRLGGDEFLIMLPETNSASAKEVVSRVQRHLSEAVSQNQFPITFSIGVATFKSRFDSLDEMIQHADELMYKAKHSGKNAMQCEEY